MKTTKFTTSTVFSIAVLAMFLTTLMLPMVQGIVTHGHYTISEIQPDIGVFASRCDHLVNPPDADQYNAWTACGIQAIFYDSDSYESATFFFMRGLADQVE